MAVDLFCFVLGLVFVGKCVFHVLVSLCPPINNKRH